ncbi:DUF7507 domain-containing protein [Phaeodactylibacter luteus]|uniref:DUF7507 domain-containing protein n=1 Tax=Phaeodactylibacter luteus TaxID=1564516 RepID=UPI001B85CFCF|nr:DUF11 domain-containing protein [Phaeodactylibacter luteus]
MTADQEPALALSKTAAPQTYTAVGDEIVYTLVVTNIGNVTLAPVVVTDPLTGLSESFPTLLPGSSETIYTSYFIQSEDIQSGEVLNTASVAGTPPNDGPEVTDEDEEVVTLLYADLSLIKEVSDVNPNVGDVVTFTITLQNSGPDTATGVEVRDDVPEGYSNISAISGGGTVVGNTITWIVPSIGAGAFQSFTFDAAVEPSEAAADYINNAEVSAADQYDPDSSPGNDDGDQSEDDEDRAIVEPIFIDLSVEKSVSDATPDVMTTVVYTVSLTNAGPGVATEVALEDIIPSGIADITGISGGGVLNGTVVRWENLTLAAGETQTFSYEATVLPTGNYTNTVQVAEAKEYDIDSTPGNDDGDQSEDDEDRAVLSPEAIIDLELDKNINNQFPLVGEVVAFTIDLSNQGPSVATGVAVTDKLPNGYLFTEAQPSQGTYNPSNGRWNVGTLPANGTATLTLYAEVRMTGDYTNLAEVTAANEQDIDSAPGNGVDTDGDGQVQNDPGDEDDGDGVIVSPERLIDLELVKTVNDATPVAGQTVTFEIAVANEGPFIATGVEVTDLLPSGFTFVQAYPFSYNPTTGVWPVGSLGAGSSRSLFIDAIVNPEGDYRNVAFVSAADQRDMDSVPGNGADSNDNGMFPSEDEHDEDDGDDVQIIIEQLIDLELEKSVAPASAFTGDTVSFTITLVNQGPSHATGVEVADQLPSGFAFLSAAPGYDAESGIWMVGNLQAGESTELVIQAIVNAAGSYLNLAEVAAANEPDIDSTPGNGVDTDGDGDFTDDSGDEDDGDGAELNVPCDISALTTDVRCDDNGTPADSSDDTYTFTLTVMNEGGGSEGWTAVWQGQQLSGTYGVPQVFGPYNIEQTGNVTFFARDSDDPSCLAPAGAIAPATCSQDCAVTLTSVETFCDGNGTPGDPTDDVFYFNLAADAFNAGVGYRLFVAGEQVHNYAVFGGQPAQNVGPFPIIGGAIEVTISADEVTGCELATMVDPPAACSFDCSITPQVVNIRCMDNGTPADAADDRFFADLLITANNSGSNGWDASNGETGFYGELMTTPLYPIAGGPVSLSFTDSENAACTAAIALTPPATCSEQCLITSAEASNVVCDDNGTPANPADDTFTFQITVEGVNTAGSWTAAGGQSGFYGQPASFGPYAIADYPQVTVLITDGEDLSCTQAVEVTAPSACSDACTIDLMVAQEPYCSDNGTPSDPTDDVYYIDVLISGSNLGNGWSAIGDTQGNTIGLYNQVSTFGPYLPGQEISLGFTDNSAPACSAVLSRAMPAGTCSDVCNITITNVNTPCLDNGTPFDGSDDQYFVTMYISGSNTSGSWNGPDGRTGPYNDPEYFGPYPISAGMRTISIADAGDSGCSATVTVMPPPPCVDCKITPELIGMICDDNGTPSDPADDQYYAEVTATGEGSAASTWRWRMVPGGTYQALAPYGETAWVGPFPIAGGNKTVRISDGGDNGCTADLLLIAPAPCAVQPCSLAATVAGVVCEDNGTPTDPTDDTFSFDFNVEAAHTDLTDWTAIINGELVNGSLGTTALSGFAVGEDLLITAINLAGAPDCQAEPIVVEAPGACSDDCAIAATATAPQCDDNGTPFDPSDDTYRFVLTVAAVNNAATGWTAVINGQTYTEPYGSLLITGVPAAQNLLIQGLHAIGDPSCQAAPIEIAATGVCAEDAPCNLQATVVDGTILCDDNGTPGNPADDSFTFGLLVENSGAGTSWMANNGTTGAYGQVATFGPFPAADAGGTLSFTVEDADQESCGVSFEVAVPNCTNDCNLDANILNMACDDQGTADPLDDTYAFDLVIHGSHVGETWTAENGTAGTFGDTISFGPYLIAEGNVTFNVTPDANDNCVLTVLVTAPHPCSVAPCGISAQALDVACNNAGTPESPADDTFTFSVLIDGDDVGANWIAYNAAGLPVQFGLFGVPAPINASYLIAEGDALITIRDLSNPDCEFLLEVPAPAPCSVAPCEILAQAAASACDDNGTPADPSDDTFTFTLRVTGGGDSFVSELEGVAGAYDTTYTFGPYPVGQDLAFSIADAAQDTCTATVVVEAPNACSNVEQPCDIASVSAFNINCDDQGTADASDDLFTFQLLVLSNGAPGGTAGWALDLGGQAITGAFNEPSVVIEVPATITGEGGTLSIQVYDANSTDCFQALTFSLPIALQLECPEDTDQASRLQTVQYLDGVLEDSSPQLHALCEQVGGAAVGSFMDTASFTVEQGGAYTFVLFSALPQEDGYGMLYEGPYQPLMPCNNLIDTTAALEDDWAPVPLGGLATWPTAGLEPVRALTAQLSPNEVYTLLSTTMQAGAQGAYRWVVFTQDGGSLQSTVQPGWRTDTATVAYGLFCTDVGHLLGNSVSRAYTGDVELEDFCGVDSLFFNDQLLADGDCSAQVINRTFTVMDIRGNTSSCAQEITVKQPEVGDVQMPRLFSRYDCADEWLADANGHPHPQASGYPYVQAAFGVHTLEEPYCNLSAVYTDGPEVAECAGTYAFERTWSIMDSCEPDGVRTFVQTIKVGDFSAPVVNCATATHYCPVLEDDIMLFPTDPFDCSATIEVPMPEVEDACSDTWTVLTEVLSVQPDGQGNMNLVALDTLFSGDLRLITGLEIGEYKFRYTVTDDCGNTTEQLCHFRVADQSEPVAICTNGLNVSVGGFGLARLYTQHIDAGSYDNCGVDSIRVRRVYERDEADCSGLPEPVYGQWGSYVEFSCCDAGTYVTVELRVADIHGNVNMCWTDILVEDKTLPTCYGLEDVAADCSDLPAAFDPYDLHQLDSLFGTAHVIDNCSAETVELEPMVALTSCGAGTITRRFIAIDRVGNISADTFLQVVTLGGAGGFDVRFPADVRVAPGGYQSGDLPVAGLWVNGCDSVGITFTDTLVAGGAAACARILRTYEVTNWCTFDGTGADTLSRDPACLGLPGQAPVWLLSRPGGLYVDADSLALNSFPEAGVRDTLCNGQTNPEGYWQKVPNTGRWYYTQVIYLEDGSFEPYAIVFPKDSLVYSADLSADSVRLYASLCDSVTVSHRDSLVYHGGYACYQVWRTWEVTNWDEYDGLSGAVVVGRNEGCDSLPGLAEVWAHRQLDTAYIDADSLFANAFPLEGAKDTLCGGEGNPQGYWRGEASTGRWQYTQVLFVQDTAAPVITFTAPDAFCSFDANSCAGQAELAFTVTDSSTVGQWMSPEVSAFLDEGADGLLDGAVTLTGAYPNYRVQGTFPAGSHAIYVEAVRGCGEMAAAWIPFEIADCYVAAPPCYDALAIELIPLAPGTDIDGDGQADAAYAEVTMDYLMEAMDTIADCNGPIALGMNRSGEEPAAGNSLEKLILTCHDGESVEVELWSWDQAQNPYALQPDGTVGGRNYDRCVTTIHIQSVAGLCSPAPVRPGNEAGPVLPEGLMLGQNTPNPFMQATAIPFYLPKAGEARLTVRDMQGRVVFSKAGYFEAGAQQWELSREALPSTGVLAYTLQFGSERLTRQLIILE